jgi:hypothetical protein
VVDDVPEVPRLAEPPADKVTVGLARPGEVEGDDGEVEGEEGGEEVEALGAVADEAVEKDDAGLGG